jgi:hypothetical protein
MRILKDSAQPRLPILHVPVPGTVYIFFVWRLRMPYACAYFDTTGSNLDFGYTFQVLRYLFSLLYMTIITMMSKIPISFLISLFC